MNNEFRIKNMIADSMLYQLEQQNKETLKFYYTNLEQENKQLKEQLEQASDYIKDRFDGEVFTHTFDKCNMRELCEILKIKFEENWK